MKHQIKTIIIIATAIMGISSFGNANEIVSKSETQEYSNRITKKLGAYLGILGDPHPTVVGANLAYNVVDYMRASIGIGKISVSTLSFNDQGNFSTEETSMTTLGLGARFMVPNWNFTPTLGLGYSRVFMSNGSLGFNEDYKSNNFYTNLGFDWQTDNGFNLGAGLNISLNSGAPSAPYLNIGWFFL